MSITVTQFKTKVTGKLHGTSLAKVTDVYGKMFEAAGKVRLRVFPPSLMKSAAIANAIYDKVFNYACQDDCDTQSIVDIRPIGDRSIYDDNIPTQGVKQFDIKKAENSFTIEYLNGVKTLRLSKQLTPRSILARCEDLSDSTIVASGDASNLTVDYLDHVSGGASLKFDLSGTTGQGVITFDLAGPVDLSKLLNLGALFDYFKFPLASALTNVELRWGTSAANYWKKSVTAAQDRAFADNAWLLLNHQWVSATKVGTPDAAAITHIELIVNYTAGTARTGVGIDSITAALGEAWEVLYYSNCLYTNAAGTVWKQQPTLDSDLIRLDDDAINLLLYEFMLTLQQEIKGKNMATDYSFFQTELFGRFGARGVKLTAGLYELYHDKYPSQVPPRQQTYYEFDQLDGHGNSGEGFD